VQAEVRRNSRRLACSRHFAATGLHTEEARKTRSTSRSFDKHQWPGGRCELVDGLDAFHENPRHSRSVQDQRKPSPGRRKGRTARRLLKTPFAQSAIALRSPGRSRVRFGRSSPWPGYPRPNFTAPIPTVAELDQTLSALIKDLDHVGCWIRPSCLGRANSVNTDYQHEQRGENHWGRSMPCWAGAA